ncbi:hypothetical protein JNJ66_02925 [Candidatus Saccharibacteria bacterium]|nr:hypothetical protein [Candidatus Saccharibacteria bacterium]
MECRYPDSLYLPFDTVNHLWRLWRLDRRYTIPAGGASDDAAAQDVTLTIMVDEREYPIDIQQPYALPARDIPPGNYPVAAGSYRDDDGTEVYFVVELEAQNLMGAEPDRALTVRQVLYTGVDPSLLDDPRIFDMTDH